MQGTIQATKMSKSGKSLGVCINDKWYSAKAFELAQLKDKEITFTTSHQSFSDGGGIDWINDYSEVGGNTPADAAFNAAHQQQAPPMGSPQPPQSAPAPQPSGVDRDASIVAQALAKSVTHATAEQAWASYVFLYDKALNWSPTDVPFDDEIPGW